MTADLDRAIDVIIASLRSGGTLYAAGNGGSDCDAAHLVGELIGSMERRDRPGLPAVWLTCGAHTSGIANDYGWERVLARQVEALMRAKDVLVVFTTSGRSRNVRLAMEAAREANAGIVALTGPDGTAWPEATWMDEDGRFGVRSTATTTATIQEQHSVWIHEIARRVEEVMCPR